MEMIFLADMDFTPIKPDFGLLFWTTAIFLIFWFVMAKFAFGPIRDALKKRNGDIDEALAQAEKAKAEMANLKSENEALMAQTREERALILREAKETKDSIVKEAKDKAKEEAQRIVSEARQEIDNQKNAAMMEIKSQAGNMALQIAEKIIKKQLAGDTAQEDYANGLVDDMKLN